MPPADAVIKLPESYRTGLRVAALSIILQYLQSGAYSDDDLRDALDMVGTIPGEIGNYLDLAARRLSEHPSSLPAFKIAVELAIFTLSNQARAL
jgi:hypothetical protein